MAFVKYERDGNIAIVTLNRPDRLNALGRELIEDLELACMKFENDPQARVAILTNSGGSFSAGADLKEAVKGQHIGIMTDHVDETMRKITKPVVAAVRGFVLGGGLWALLLNADIRIAAAGSTFGMPEIALAIPAVPHFFLVQNIPLSAAMELVLNEDPMPAQRAYDIGLVNKVVPDEQLMLAAMDMAEKIARLSPWATRLIREARLKAVMLTEQALELKEIRQKIRSELTHSEDYREALRAIAKKHLQEHDT
jgi:enoyl-CoA hydratase